ncbi:MAG: hypothetical protein [Apis rhabdovirus 5]|nr:MAG: hypothetical protein [Apis rhabdovirus 5]UCR92544.1 MAG: hypothetical protein [Apis rhabdovirus 5]UCR92549.1 MAG: hypothetical protein [Apis rhabdovirus 5]WIL00262.1 MAG: hypothetical protein [Apis rhabdovirus 5]WIL00267.1 MAG: hypothetical protein [Apis rhabdovirus 5]
MKFSIIMASSFSFRLRGDLRVHGIDRLDQTMSKQISKLILSELLDKEGLPQELISTLCLRFSKHIIQHHCLAREGVSEAGDLYALFCDYDLKGFSSMSLRHPLTVTYSSNRNIQGNVVSPDRQRQIRVVCSISLSLAPFNLKNWDLAVGKSFIPVIPPQLKWYDDIIVDESLSKAVHDVDSESGSSDKKLDKQVSLLDKLFKKSK